MKAKVNIVKLMDGGVLTQLDGARQAVRLCVSQYTAVRLVLVMVYLIRIKISYME